MEKTTRQILAISWTGAGIITLAALLAIPLGDSFRLWGIDALAFLDPVARWSYVSSILLITFLSYFIFRYLEDQAFSYFIPWRLIIAFLFAILTYMIPAATFLRGDGQLIINNLSIFDPASHRSPLTAIISGTIFNATAPLGMNPQTVYHVMDSLAAFVFMLAVLKVTSWFTTFTGQALIALAFVFSGVTITMFGVVEQYPLAFAVLLLALIYGFESTRKQQFPIIAILLVSLAIPLHVSAVIILPALVFTWPGIQPRRAWIISLVFALVGLILARIASPGQFIAPFGPASPGNYTFWSLRHILDLINLLFWAAPVLILCLIPCFFLSPPKETTNADRFLIMVTLGAAGFTLLFDPDLGLARDADLLSLFVLPTTLLVVSRLHRLEKHLAPLVLPAILLIGLFSTGARVIQQSSEQASVARFLHLLQLDERRSSYGWEALAMYHRNNGDYEEEMFAYKQAIRFGEHPRYLTRLAQLAIQRENYDRAADYAQRAITADSTFALAHGVLGQIYYAADKDSLAEIEFRNALRLQPVEGTHYANLAAFLADEGQLDAGLEIAEEGIQKTQPNAQFYYSYGRLLEADGQDRKAFEYYSLAAQMPNARPWSDLAQQAKTKLLGSPGVF